MIFSPEISQLHSMYPSVSFMLDAQHDFAWQPEMLWGSAYGYSFGAATLRFRRGNIALQAEQYFSLWLGDQPLEVDAQDSLFLVIRLGFRCQDTLGWVESQGRLSYIDGCTDSLLIYPPRQGDPSLNLLYFPGGIEQTRHLHPSIRMGCVIQGQGWSDVWERGQMQSRPLRTGSHFCLTENELHRFRTESDSMTVIAWHPDGDWGPTDHNHTMLNRTYTQRV